MRKLFLTVSFILSLLLVSCDQLNRELSTGDIQVDFPGTSSRTIYSSTINKEDILKKPENAIFRLYLIDEKGFTVTSTVGKPGGTAVFNNIKEGLYTLKCYYGLSASKTNAVAAAYSSVTVRAGETANVTLDLSYNRSNLIEKVNVEWAGNNVFYGSPEYLDDYIKENTLIDFYLSNGWNESFVADDPAMNLFCNYEDDVVNIITEETGDNTYLATVIFCYRKTPDGELIEKNKNINITITDNPYICPDWATLKSKIKNTPTGTSTTYILTSENYEADSQIDIPAGTIITITTDESDVCIKPKNTGMDHLFAVASGADFTIDGGDNIINLDGRYNETYTFTGALVLVNSSASLTVDNAVYFTETATNSQHDAAAISIETNGKCSISSSVIFDGMYSRSEVSCAGGAISNYGELTIEGASFDNCNTECETTGGGAAIYSAGSKLDISNAHFNNCTSLNKGGAIFIASGTNNKISSCSFTNNEAMNGDNDIHTEDGATYTRN